MSRLRSKSSRALVERMLEEASWLLSHAQSLADYGRPEEAAAELARAASCEEQVASLLDAVGRETEAVLHRVSAASCHEQLGQFPRAVTLLHAALSAAVGDGHRRRIRKQLSRCLAKAQRQLARSSVRSSPTHMPAVR